MSDTLKDKIKWWWYTCWVRRWWNDQWNYFANRWWRKWNHIHIKTLDEQWRDRDHVLLHAMFQILVDFVEGENPGCLVERTEFNDEDEWDRECAMRQEAQNKEIRTLYKWWKETYPSRKDPLSDVDCPAIDDMFGPKSEEFDKTDAGKKWHEACKSSWEIDEKQYEEETEMMTRLVKIRQCLWT